MPRVHVTSEIAELESVLVHTPGRELEAVTPGNREDYLYDDIIEIEAAQREHRQFAGIGAAGFVRHEQLYRPARGIRAGSPTRAMIQPWRWTSAISSTTATRPAPTS